MNGIGLDCGTATVKLAMLSQERELLWFKSSASWCRSSNSSGTSRRTTAGG